MKLELDIECRACLGTGLYVGIGERDGAAVVCHHCKGTGCEKFVLEYAPFNCRNEFKDKKTKRVFDFNPGFVISDGGEYELSDYGGMPFEDWLDGKPFPKGSEMRRNVCPAWWYQGVDSDRKPHWDECVGVGSFSNCKMFKDKDQCWKKWDKVYGKEK